MKTDSPTSVGLPEGRVACSPPPLCGACGSDSVEHLAEVPLYLPKGSAPDTIWRCRYCGTYIRGLNFADPAVQSHFNAASYTDPANEERFRALRKGFFENLVRLTRRFVRADLADCRILDIGAAYGHLIDAYRSAGVRRIDAIEIVEPLRRALESKGIDAFRDPSDIPPERRFQVVALIDSLYCVEKPADLLIGLSKRLAEDGVVLIRVTNRTHILNFLRLLRCRLTADHVGDAKHNFSPRGLRMLLERTGYRIVYQTVAEPGKKFAAAGGAWLYRAGRVASAITGKPLAQGLTVIARAHARPEDHP